MLNTTSTMAFSEHLLYMTPTRSSARRPLTMTGRDCAGDYFASSADFEYDLFLHGLVSCDSALPSFASSSGSNGSAGNALTTSSSSSSASSSFSTSGFFSRYRASRPVSTASPVSGYSSRQQHQQSGGHRSNQSLLTALSITSLNRSSAYEQSSDDSAHYQTVSRPSLFAGGSAFGEHQPHHHQQAGICSQQHRMKNMLASNLSLGSSLPMNTVRPNLLEEMGGSGGHGGRNREKQTALKQTAAVDPQLDPSSVNVDNLSHQQLHALHRFRRQKKKGFLCRLRDVVISFTPKARVSIVNRPDLFVRFGLQEKEALACFDFLDKEGGYACGRLENVVDATETLVTTDDLLAEWKNMEKEEEEEEEEAMKKCSVDATTTTTITATLVPPLKFCDSTLTTPFTSSSTTTCSNAAMIKEDSEGSEGCRPAVLDLSLNGISVIHQADRSMSGKSLEDSEPPSSSASTTALGDDSSSVSRANSGNNGNKAGKKKSKQKKAKVGKSR